MFNLDLLPYECLREESTKLYRTYETVGIHIEALSRLQKDIHIPTLILVALVIVTIP